MSCTFFIPQVQAPQSDHWVSVAKPMESFEEAEKLRARYMSNGRVANFRVLQTSCKDEVVHRRCCGK